MAQKPNSDSFNLLNRYLRLKTSPVAVKLVRKEEQLDQSIKSRKPRSKLAVCQLVNLARYYGWTMIAKKEDMACAPGAAALGLISMPDNIVSGRISHGIHQETIEAARRMQESVPRIAFDQYQAILTAPLESATFAPHLVMIYGNSAQIMRLIHGALWTTGERLQFSTAGEYSTCGDGIAQTMLSGRPQVVIPCYGERIYGVTQDDEIVFVIPQQYLVSVLEGVEKTHSAGVKYPIPFYGTRAELPRVL